MEFEKFSPIKLNRMYTKVKIKTDPFNYKLSDRIIPATLSKMFGLVTSKKSFTTELLILNKLGYTCTENLHIRKDLCESVWGTDTGVPIEYYTIGTPLLLKLNHLYITENVPITLNRLNHLKADWSKKSVRELDDMLDENIILPDLETLVTLYEKCVSKASLIPYMYYLLTDYKDYTLNDLVNNVHFAKALSTNTPILADDSLTNLTCLIYETGMSGTGLESDVEDVTVRRTIRATPSSFMTHTTKGYVPHKKLSTFMVLVYGCEVMYQLSKVMDESNKADFSKLFNYKATGFETDVLYASAACGKIHVRNITSWLYSMEHGYIKINPAVEDLFNDNMEIRFNNYQKYVSDLIASETKAGSLYNLDCITKGEPNMVFSKVLTILIPSLYEYSAQKYRVSLLQYLIILAKSKGIDISRVVRASKGEAGSGYTSMKGLLDLDTCTYDDDDEEDLDEEDDDSEDEEDEDEDEDEDSGGHCESNENGPALEDLEVLKNDLSKSKYNYNIRHVSSTTTSSSSEYNNISNNLDFLAKLLSKKIKDIKTYNSGGKQPGQSSGKLDRKNLWKYRQTPNIFYNNNYKIKEMDLAFGIILDQSGSMGGSGIENGRIAMILLHKVLTALSINHSIIGHDSKGMHQSNIYPYYYFNEEYKHSIATPYALAKAKALNGNCDSGALYYMQSLFKRVHNKDKICIIFSDGQPTECTGVELRQQVKNMEKDGIHVIGVGINFSDIKDYYSDNANGKTLTDMCNIIVSILSRYVLEVK